MKHTEGRLDLFGASQPSGLSKSLELAIKYRRALNLAEQALESGDTAQALEVVREALVLPAVLPAVPYDPLPGCDITEAAQIACDQARHCRGPVALRFNGIEIRVEPFTPAGQVVYEWWAQAFPSERAAGLEEEGK
jgi:hypothetical protein